MGKSIYTPELAQRVLDVLERTGSLRAACREVGINRETVVRWVVDDLNGFGVAYARSKDIGIDNLVDETLEISDAPPGLNQFGGVDTGHVAHSKLRIETRRWLAERMAPKRYGLKQGLDVTNSDASLQVDETTRSARVAQLLALASQRKDFEDLA
jgi:hypothetical protein